MLDIAFAISQILHDFNSDSIILKFDTSLLKAALFVFLTLIHQGLKNRIAF